MERKKRKLLEVKNKTVLNRNKQLLDDYFEEHCQGIESPNIIHLKPIVDWSDTDVWDYINSHNLPINPEYQLQNRVGCVVCPKANFNTNYIFLLNHPKLIDSFIKARQKANHPIDWIITSENKDYEHDKCYYICRWLNHSFMPFTKKQYMYYMKVKQAYDNINKHV